jgi:hypothetical protein
MSITPPSGDGAPIVEDPSLQPQPDAPIIETPPAEASTEIPADSPFASFQPLRDSMVAAGVDLSGMESKFNSGQDLSQEELSLIGQHANVSPDYVKVYLSQVRESQALAGKAQGYQDAEDQAFFNEMDKVAGGSWQGLMDFVAEKAPPSQIKIWNAALATNEKEVQRDVLAQMQEYRQGLTNPSVAPTQARGSANLDLLAQSQTTAPVAPPAPSLPTVSEGNPLEQASLQHLSAIKLSGPGHPQYAQAMEVFKAYYPQYV